MLHELLLALAGLPGDLFTPFPSQTEHTSTFKIPSDFPFLHEAEKSSLEQLVVLGNYYRAIVNFLDFQRGRKANYADSKHVTSTPTGSFLQALCNALNEVLKDFHKTVIECETRVLNKEDDMGGVVPISQIVSAFRVYYIIFPHLHQLTTEINREPEKYFGCRLLNLIVDKCNTGVPELRAIMLRLLHACHAVMYKHITSWMVYGHLQDPFGEFFVKDVTLRDHDTQVEEFNQSRWHKRFVLDESFVPNHIAPDIAKSILFVGKAIATVRNAAKPHEKNYCLPRSLNSLHLQHLLELSSRPIFRQIELENTVDIIRNNVAQWLWQVVLTGDKIIECLEAFRNYFLLGQGDFAISLVDQFEKLAASKHISSKVLKIKEQELNSLLVRASVGTLAESDLTFEKFRFKILNKDDEMPPITKTNIFDNYMLDIPLRLEYDIGWPLDLFVTSEDLNKYGDIFSFLISLRRTQIRLQRAWAHLAMTRKSTSDVIGNKSNDMNSQRLMPWRVRASMMFFLDCLWGHMQMDIIEANFQKLVCRINASSAHHQRLRTNTTTEPDTPTASTHKKTTYQEKDSHLTEKETLRDFEDIRIGHSSYLGDILRGCLLESPICSDAIKKSLNICDQVCGLLERWDGKLTDKDRLDQVVKLDKEFREQVAFLFRTLSGVNKTGEGFGGPPRHLDQLLLRMDYSKWFSAWSN
ncbi:2839_t:CDS:1 [Acaulospora morrowiae]|uniref:Spindle pole body component n=1 Tax=Acaulospora morrowiae TaxID=94023 RepID=A0A9N9GP62_9GLOM|nr:2839_t:CDS:1 [Acaulospora morrowiae]